MDDNRRSGPHRELWALPSEDLPPGAAEFLEMARDLEPGPPDDGAAPETGELAPVVPLRGEPAAEVPDDAQSPVVPDGDPTLRVVGTPVDEDVAPEDDPGARLFLEMVDRAETVRTFPSRDGSKDWSGVALPDLLWPDDEEGSEHSEALLTAIEQAMRYVNQSEHINEELRARLLDLFTDFAVRRPWKEERPRAQS